MDGRRLGVEPICEVLQVAPSTYYAARNRPLWARAQRDALLVPQLVELWKENYEVYGSRKLWKAARRAGIDIGRDQTRRLMRQAGIQGARRSKRVRTTRRDHSAGRHPDLVKRDFAARAPNRLWVTDLTFWRRGPALAGALRGHVRDRPLGTLRGGALCLTHLAAGQRGRRLVTIDHSTSRDRAPAWGTDDEPEHGARRPAGLPRPRTIAGDHETITAHPPASNPLDGRPVERRNALPHLPRRHAERHAG